MIVYDPPGSESVPGIPGQGTRCKDDFEDEVHRYWKTIFNWNRKEWVQKRKQDGSAPKKGPAPKGLDNKKTRQRGNAMAGNFVSKELKLIDSEHTL